MERLCNLEKPVRTRRLTTLDKATAGTLWGLPRRSASLLANEIYPIFAALVLVLPGKDERWICYVAYIQAVDSSGGPRQRMPTLKYQQAHDDC